LKVLESPYNKYLSLLVTTMILWYLHNIMTLAIRMCCIAIIWCYVSSGLQLQCTQPVSKPMNICIGKVP